MQNKVLFLLTLVLLSLSLHAQRGVRVAYIDTEYILENVPEYQEAVDQLNQKADKWKNEIEVKLSAIEQKRQDLSNEKALLTKELIQEREEDIYFEEKEILDYQQKRFGPNGDLYIQQSQLTKPVLDQIFAAVQDIATSRKYDFIFDKSSDANNMLFSARQYDLSETVIRSITRTAKRTQAQSKAERKAAEAEDLVPEINLEQEAREKALEEKKKARESAIEEARQKKLAAREAKVKEAEARRQKILEDREKARQAKLDARNQTTDKVEESATDTKTQTEEKAEAKTREQLIEENRLKKLAEREARMKTLEEKKKKILEERQKALEERKRIRDSINNNK